MRVSLKSIPNVNTFRLEHHKNTDSNHEVRRHRRLRPHLFSRGLGLCKYSFHTYPLDTLSNLFAQVEFCVTGPEVNADYECATYTFDSVGCFDLPQADGSFEHPDLLGKTHYVAPSAGIRCDVFACVSVLPVIRLCGLRGCTLMLTIVLLTSQVGCQVLAASNLTQGSYTINGPIGMSSVKCFDA